VGRRNQRRRVADRCRWVEQRQPGRISHGRRIAVGVGLANRRDRTPELPVVLVVPAADQGVCRGQVLHREQASVLDDVQVLAGGQSAKDPVPQRDRLVLPEDRSIGLVRGSGRAGERADLLEFVEVFRVVVTGERVWPVGAEHLCARNHEWQHVPDPRRGVVREVRRRRPPDARRWRVQRWRRSEASVIHPRLKHCRGCRLTDSDPRSLRSRWVVGQARYVRIVEGLQRPHLPREDT